MIALCLFLCACSQGEDTGETDWQWRYQDAAHCQMEAVVRCDQEGLLWEATMTCDYVPEGESTVEVLSPEHLAGVKAVVSDTDWQVLYEDLCLDMGPLSREQISPAACLPRLMDALREGWVLSRSEENREDVPCLRLELDQTGQEGKILSTIWLRQEDDVPLRGEIAVDDTVILTAEFTNFTFYDTMQSDTDTEEGGA